MAVRIEKAMRVHEAKVFRLVVGRAACGERLRDETIHLLPAAAAEVEQGFDGFRRIANGLRSEFTELGVCRKYDGNRLTDDDHRPGVAGNLGIVGKTQR